MKLKIEDMKTILVHAYTFLNLGDDLFLKILLERYPDVKFRIIGNRKMLKFVHGYSNADIIDFPTPNRYLWFLSRYIHNKIVFYQYFKKIKALFKWEEKMSDGFLVIGGSLFMETGPAYFKKTFYSIIYTVFEKKPKLILGSNFGPYKNEDFKSFFTDIFNRSSDVCLRDLYSYELFKNLPTVRFAPDIVFQLNFKPSLRVEKSIGLSLIDLTERSGLSSYQDNYNNLIVKLIDYYHSNDFAISLFSFCEGEGDTRAINNVVAKLTPAQKNKIDIVKYTGDIDSFLYRFYEMESIVCSRFHSMILSLNFKQNIFPLSYSKKITNVLEDLNYKGTYKRIEDIDSNTITEIINTLSTNNVDILSAIEKSKTQFKKLDSLLNYTEV